MRPGSCSCKGRASVKGGEGRRRGREHRLPAALPLPVSLGKWVLRFPVPQFLYL